jgi:hypothetical protein
MAHIGTEVKDKVVPHTAGRTPVNAYEDMNPLVGFALPHAEQTSLDHLK